MTIADDAKRACEFAFAAMNTAQAYGTLFEALIGTLRDQQMMTPSQTKVVFLGAAANIDVLPSEDELRQQAKRQMREIIVRIAARSGVEIPPPGQTGIQRKQ